MPTNHLEGPYIERPDEHEVTGDQLFCWIQWNRECGGDCVAFEERATADTSQRMSFCKALNSVRSVALSFTILAEAAQHLIADKQRQSKKQASNELKAEIDKIPPPPKVIP